MMIPPPAPPHRVFATLPLVGRVAIAHAMAGWGRGVSMPITHISRFTRERARELRNTLTPPERKLWKYLRQMEQLGFHFRRQAPIGPYVADFAELTRKLIIELDEESYGDAQALRRDARRDHFLLGAGFRIVRISNSEISRNCQGVAEHIMNMVKLYD
jgi:very-short-patch-repair endonuclease